jgi:hypothetical protein
MAKAPAQAPTTGANTRWVEVKVLSKAYINRRLYEVGETARLEWAIDEQLPKHLEEIKEVKEED